MQEAISYLRLSKKNEKGGYSFAVQDRTNNHFADVYHYRIVKTVREVKTGRNINRVILNNTLEECRQKRWTLIISKLDRMARNVLFVATIIETDIDFKIATTPHANKYDILHQAVYDQQELDTISLRTKDALAEAKRRGVKLGYHAHRNPANNKNKKRSENFAKDYTALFVRLRNMGYSFREITDYLNLNKFKSYTGMKEHWHLSTVYSIWLKIKNEKKEITPKRSPTTPPPTDLPLSEPK